MDALLPNPKLRFAPSPNGYLHLGHAFGALKCAAMAKALSGQFFVRIEDIDTGRAREEFVAAIYEDLSWLGLTWQEPVLVQSARFAFYKTAADKLMDLGVLYPCFATRAEILRAVDGKSTERDPDGAVVYPGIYRGLPSVEAEKKMASGQSFALRIDMQKACELVLEKTGGRGLTFVERDEDGGCAVVEAQPQRWGDAIIVRKDLPASYHLAVVVDDAAQNITYVTRGRDLYRASDLHRLLQVLLGLPEPVYHHHSLILDEAGRKLSKSDGSTSLRALRAAGWTRDDVYARLGLA